MRYCALVAFHKGYVACHDREVVNGGRVEVVEDGAYVEEVWMVVLGTDSEVVESGIDSGEGAIVGFEIDEVVDIDGVVEMDDVFEKDEVVDIDGVVEMDDVFEKDEVVEVDDDVEHSTVGLEPVIEVDSEAVAGVGLATLTIVILNSFVTVLGCSSLITVTDMIEVGAGSLTDAEVIEVFIGTAVATAEGIVCSVLIIEAVSVGFGCSLTIVGVASELPSTATTE